MSENPTTRDDIETWIRERVDELDAGDMTTDEDLERMDGYAQLRTYLDANEAEIKRLRDALR